MPPRTTRCGFGINDHKRAPGATQEVSHGECGLTAANNRDIHFGTVGRHWESP